MGHLITHKCIPFATCLYRFMLCCPVLSLQAVTFVTSLQTGQSLFLLVSHSEFVCQSEWEAPNKGHYVGLVIVLVF